MRLYLRSADRRPDPDPLITDDRRTIIVGMVVWGVLWVAAIIGHRWLADTGRGWWVWTPPAALALGVIGLRYIRRRTERGPAPTPTDRPDPD